MRDDAQPFFSSQYLSTKCLAVSGKIGERKARSYSTGRRNSREVQDPLLGLIWRSRLYKLVQQDCAFPAIR